MRPAITKSRSRPVAIKTKRSNMDQPVHLKILNPRHDWVRSEFEKLLREWEEWQVTVSKIEDHPDDKRTHTEVFADGEENMERHEILQAKTLTFLNINIEGHNFIRGFDGEHIDRNDLRLNVRVKHRLRDLRILKECLQYADVADGFWAEKGKEILDTISTKAPAEAIKIIAGYLKNPFSG